LDDNLRLNVSAERKLNSTGKVKVNPTITYTPRAGAPLTQKLKLKLTKKEC
jgi:hypothetical protein